MRASTVRLSKHPMAPAPEMHQSSFPLGCSWIGNPLGSRRQPSGCRELRASASGSWAKFSMPAGSHKSDADGSLYLVVVV